MEDWPEAVRDELATDFRANVALELFRAHSIAWLFDQLSRQGIPFLVTKGEALAHTHYSSPALRPRVDTDVFIHMRDIDLVQQALCAAGYEIVPPIYKSHQFMAVRNHGRATMIFDFHWRILNNPGFARAVSFEEALEHSVPVPARDGVRTLCATHALLLACMHLKGSQYHDEQRLIWLYDIHMLASRLDENQWNEFAQHALKKHVQAACLACLRMAQECFASSLPKPVMEKLTQSSPKKSAAREFSQSNLGLLLDDWKHLPNFKSRKALLHELFLPPVETLQKEYGRIQTFLLPLLWLRYISSRLYNRLTFR